MAGRWAGWLLPDGLLFICTMLAEDCKNTAEMYDADGQCARGIEFLFMGKKMLLALLTERGGGRLCLRRRGLRLPICGRSALCRLLRRSLRGKLSILLWRGNPRSDIRNGIS
jgi:hypothetical protein